MSPSPGSSNFDELQRLLALKRREQPPRRYFSGFSDQVLENLGAPERPETLSWLERLGVHCDLSPAVVGALAVLMVVLLSAGIAVSHGTKPLAPGPPLVPPSGAPVPLDTTANSSRPLQNSPRPQEIPSTAPVVTPDSPPFIPFKLERTGLTTPVREPK